MAHEQAQREWRNIALWLLLVVVGAIVWYFLSAIIDEGKHAKAKENLFKIGQACALYASQNPQKFWPPLSLDPRPLSLDVSSLDTSFVDASQLESPAARPAQRPFGGRSYYYLGYAVWSEDDGLALIEAMRVVGLDALEPFQNLVTDTHEFYALRENVDHVIIRDLEQKDLEVLEERLLNSLNEAGLIEKQSSIRSLISEWLLQPAYATSWSFGSSEIPVLIEHPSLLGDGGHVLYLDGRVEFIRYPGKFPMTERFIAVLESMETVSR